MPPHNGSDFRPTPGRPVARGPGLCEISRAGPRPSVNAHRLEAGSVDDQVSRKKTMNAVQVPLKLSPSAAIVLFLTSEIRG